MRFSVCITSIREAVLEYSVRSVAEQSYRDWELVVVGQGPEEEALRAAVERGAPGDRRVRYFHLAAKGRSVALNAAIRASRGEIIAVTDDDCEADRDWLATLEACFAAEPETSAVGGAVVESRARRWQPWSFCPAVYPEEALYDPVADGRQAPRGWEWLGANVAFRRDVYARVGPFDDYLGPGGRFPAAEDVDYKLRMEALGLRVRTTPRVTVRHTYGRRSGLRARMAHARAYCAGNGALAAKLTLQGDPRGLERLALERARLRGVWREPHRFPFRLRNVRAFEAAYRRCLTDLTLDPSGTRLAPSDAGSGGALGPASLDGVGSGGGG